MNKVQQARFDSLYRQHVSALKRQGKAESTIDVYSRALRRITEFFDCPPDNLKREQFETYFDALVQTHSWSTVKVDRNGLQKSFKAIVRDVGIHKNISVHSLRHCYGTLLTEAGVRARPALGHQK